MVGQLSVVVPAGSDDLDAEVKKAEQAYARAVAQQRRYPDISLPEDIACQRVVDSLSKKVSDLRVRQFTATAGVIDEAPVAQPTRRAPDDDELQKLIDARIEHHTRSAAKDEELRTLIDARIERRVEQVVGVVAAETKALTREECRALRQYADQVAQTTAQANSKALREQLAPQFKQLRDDVIAMRDGREISLKAQVAKALELREQREAKQIDLEQRLIDCQNQISDLREALRSASLAPAPVSRTMANGRGAHNDNL